MNGIKTLTARENNSIDSQILWRYFFIGVTEKYSANPQIAILAMTDKWVRKCSCYHFVTSINCLRWRLNLEDFSSLKAFMLVIQLKRL